MVMKTTEVKPPIGKEVLFYYDDMYHIGYLVNDDGSMKPRKWEWFSYIKGYGVINDNVEYWHELREEEKE